VLHVYNQKRHNCKIERLFTYEVTCIKKNE